MKKAQDSNVQLNTLLISLFDEMTRKRQDILEDMADDAVIIMQLRGNRKFNAWAKEIASDEDPQHPRVYVEFALKPKIAPLLSKSLSWDQVEAMELQPA